MRGDETVAGVPETPSELKRAKRQSWLSMFASATGFTGQRIIQRKQECDCGLKRRAFLGRRD